MHALVLFTVFWSVSGALTAMLGPCKKGDAVCLTKAYNDAHPIVYSGIPSLGVESSDPMFVDVIEGNLSMLKYKLTNATVRGFKDCTVKNANLNMDALKLYYEMDCPNISLSGDYEISGQLILLPVEGKGTFDLVSSRYYIALDTDLKIIKKDDKSYLNIKNFKIKAEALGPIKFDFKNLFNGQKDLSEAVHKFASENWKEVADIVQDPVFKKTMKNVVTNYNKFLRTEPLEEVFFN